jgi:hypothetical protein
MSYGVSLLLVLSELMLKVIARFVDIGGIIDHYYTITALERDQYEVLWSRVQQY